MSLTVGKGPFAEDPAGRFNLELDPPTGSVLFFDPVPQRIRALFAGETVVDSKRAKLLHETGHLPVYYFPVADVRTDLLERTDKHTRCPHKGEASYWSLAVGARIAPDAAWGYEEPIEPASFLRDHVAIYWHVPDEWFAEDEQLFDLAWTYPNPQHDAAPVRDLIAFFNERIDLDVDGEAQDRPRTQWSR